MSNILLKVRGTTGGYESLKRGNFGKTYLLPPISVVA